ncbi:hypothetical protein OS187_01985 [Xanthomonadaceae bacterium JHOS43]|nr:hypothetical protein [Xanthomonadaceae bacterium JHOS43]MCX7563734.1 hypothetical protein [Xanthomonadaceae bacterium XH05]
MHARTQDYNTALTLELRDIADVLARGIDAGLQGAENRIWHAHPM